MTLKEFYQKNSSIIHWGLLGLIIGLLPIVFIPIGLWLLGAVLVIPPWAVYSIVHAVLFGSSGGNSYYPSFGAYLLSPFFYTVIGLFVGWILSRINKYIFGGGQETANVGVLNTNSQELSADILVIKTKKKIVFKWTILGGAVGLMMGLILAFPFAQHNYQFLNNEIQTYNVQRQAQGLNPISVVGAPQYSYSEILKNDFKKYGFEFMLLGAFFGLVTGMVIVKKSKQIY